VRSCTAIVVSLFAALCNASDQPKPSPSSAPAAPHSVQQLIELTPPDGGPDGSFGQSVAIAGDIVAVESFSNNIGQGKVYIYTKPSTGWQNATLTAELTVSGFSGWLAAPVVISPDGNTIVVNGTFDGNAPIRGVFVYEKPSGGWVNMTQTAALYATGGGPFDFGISIATDGDTVLVGSLGCSGNGDFSPGAVYLFVKPAGGWTNMSQTGALEETDPIGCDNYGVSVALQGNTAVVGRTGGGMVPPVTPGSLYVFTKPVGGWATMGQTAKLTALPDYLHDSLGYSAAVSGNTILAPVTLSGSPSSGAYIFTEPPGGWAAATESETLTDTNKNVKSIGAGTALNGTTAALVAEYAYGGMRALILYSEPTGGWQSVSKPSATFMPDDEALYDFFGFGGALAMSGNIIVVGSPGATRDGNSREGAVYILQQN